MALVGVEVGGLVCVVAFHASRAATAMVMVELCTVTLLGGRQRSRVVGTITAVGLVFVIVLIDGSLDLGGVTMRVPLVFVSLAFRDTARFRRGAGTRSPALRDLASGMCG